MKKSILFVDDEKQILRALNRLFFDSNYSVFMAGSSEEALRILESNDIGMIITDMRMPGIDGYQLLKAVKEKYPSILRLILSGYAEDEIVSRVMSENLARQYIFKPWDNSKLMAAVAETFAAEKSIRESGKSA